jgi:predicted phosphoribosyltransferase
MFDDRDDAGRQLGVALQRHAGRDCLVIGIPRGGVTVGLRVAEALAAKFTLLVVRKLPFPDNPESGFGAIAEDGTIFLMPGAANGMEEDEINRIIAHQQAEVKRRIKALREGQPLPDLRGRQVILVDDGIAMGSTTMAATLCCRHLGAARVTVAAPVASFAARHLLAPAADEVVVLLAPPAFHAVAQFYRHWYDVPDREVEIGRAHV